MSRILKTGTLRFRVTAWYAGLLAAALLLFSVAVYFGLEHYLETTLRRSLQDEAAAIGHNVLDLSAKQGPDFISQEVDESYAAESDARFIRITRGDGSIAYQSQAVKHHSISAEQAARLAEVPNEPFYRRLRAHHAGMLEIYALPYRTPDGRLFLIETGASLKPVHKLLRTLLLTMLLPMPFLLAIAAIGGYLLMKVPLRPITVLTRQTERIGGENFRERLPVIHSGDELERLSLALNRMLARMEDSLTHIRRFSSDVSHELRTPLTILRGELEQLVETPGVEAATAEAAGSALEEIARLSKIVESLLAIAHLDSGEAGIALERVDFEALVRSTADQLRILAEDKDVLLVCPQAPPVEVLGDAVRLRQVAVNLIDNAIKYTPAGRQVDVSTRAAGGDGLLEVCDQGIGIPASALPLVFERFYRADKARSRSSGGTGLGLSIVKAICTAHSGTVSIASVEGEGTRVTVAIPLASPGAADSQTDQRAQAGGQPPALEPASR